jgi:hypothetical protein
VLAQAANVFDLIEHVSHFFCIAPDITHRHDTKHARIPVSYDC